MKIDWKKKLCSRKLWLSIAEFVGMLVIALGYADNVATEVTALIMAGAGVIGYVIGEGLADSNNTNVIELGMSELMQMQGDKEAE